MLEKMINEPLRHFVEKHGVDISSVDKIVCGHKYSAVLLKNGNIGVCANLSNRIEVKIDDLKALDLNKIEHRIILNAYFNANLNYLNRYEKTADIFDGIDFMNYKNIVMVGLFKPLLEKFKKNNIKIHVFDLIKRNGELISIKDEMEYIKKAETIILSATSIANNTFMDIVTHSRENCDIFLLGPSSIMNRDMFEYKNIKKIFGAIFKSHDEKVLNTIKNGYGTKTFLQFGKKVSL
jgi:uncharacterized protein (DUF4213/DUF364 family)